MTGMWLLNGRDLVAKMTGMRWLNAGGVVANWWGFGS